MRRVMTMAAIGAALLLSGCATGVAEQGVEVDEHARGFASAAQQRGKDLGCAAEQLVPAGQRQEDQGEALEDDAAAAGITVEQALGQMAFGEIAWDLEQKFPEQFAEAIWTQEGGVIGFAGAVPTEALDQLCMLEGVIVHEHLGWVAPELPAAVSTLFAVAEAAGGAPMSGGADQLTREFVLLVEAEDAERYRIATALAEVRLPGDFRLALELADPGSTPPMIDMLVCDRDC